MVFDSLVVRHVAREIAAHLDNARVDRVFLPAEFAAVLEFGRQPPLNQLFLSWQPGAARVHLSSGHVPAPGLTASFVDVLRRYLRGARLASCVQVGFDRLLRLGFSNAEGLGPQSRCELILEPIGRWANAAVLDPAGLIRECARHVPVEVNRHRELLPGRPWFPPPGEDLPGLLEASPATLRAAGGEGRLRDLLTSCFQGASPTLLAELTFRTGLDLSASVADLPPAWADQLSGAAGEIAAQADRGEAWLHRPPAGKPLAYPLHLAHLGDLPAQRLPSLCAALDLLASEEATSDRRRQQAERLHAAAARALTAVQRRRRSREQALATAAEADRYRRWGEALLANLWRLPPDQAEVELPLYTEAGEELIAVPLNPAYSGQRNAQVYFDRYKKAQRAVRLIPPLLAADRRQEAYLAHLAASLEAADLDDLAELEQELRRAGLLKRTRRKVAPLPPARPYHKTTAPGDWAVWYGKTGTQNDRLLREGSPDDLWFHVRGGTGGHVLIRAGGRPDEVPEAARLFAASLAAGLTAARTSALVDVICTQLKHVRKPKGTPPGYVLYDHDTGLTVPPLWPPPSVDRPVGPAPL